MQSHDQPDPEKQVTSKMKGKGPMRMAAAAEEVAVT